MEIPIDCLIDSPESIPFITNSLPIGVILELYNYMKVKKLEVKDIKVDKQSQRIHKSTCFSVKNSQTL